MSGRARDEGLCLHVENQGVTTDAVKPVSVAEQCDTGKDPGLGFRKLELNSQAFTSCVALGGIHLTSVTLFIFSYREKTVLKT